MAKKVKKVKEVKVKVEWMDLPQKEFGQWFAEYVTAGLVLKFYAQNKRWPTRIKLGAVSVKELKDGSGLLEAELE